MTDGEETVAAERIRRRLIRAELTVAGIMALILLGVMAVGLLGFGDFAGQSLAL